jgi:hypothetical protein
MRLLMRDSPQDVCISDALKYIRPIIEIYRPLIQTSFRGVAGSMGGSKRNAETLLAP